MELTSRFSRLLFLLPVVLMCGRAESATPAAKPNVLFIAVDDLNDWLGHLGGHPLAKTPHIDGLAARGTAFLNAHCQAPLCNPSRTSVMLGLRPTSTGVYGLHPWFRTIEALRERVTLAQHFKHHGYRTFSVGKIFHGNASLSPQEFDATESKSRTGRPPKPFVPPTRAGGMDWGAFPSRDEDTMGPGCPVDFHSCG